MSYTPKPPPPYSSTRGPRKARLIRITRLADMRLNPPREGHLSVRRQQSGACIACKDLIPLGEVYFYNAEWEESYCTQCIDWED